MSFLRQGRRLLKTPSVVALVFVLVATGTGSFFATRYFLESGDPSAAQLEPQVSEDQAAINNRLFQEDRAKPQFQGVMGPFQAFPFDAKISQEEIREVTALCASSWASSRHGPIKVDIDHELFFTPPAGVAANPVEVAVCADNGETMGVQYDGHVDGKHDGLVAFRA